MIILRCYRCTTYGIGKRAVRLDERSVTVLVAAGRTRVHRYDHRRRIRIWRRDWKSDDSERVLLGPVSADRLVIDVAVTVVMAVVLVLVLFTNETLPVDNLGIRHDASSS